MADNIELQGIEFEIIGADATASVKGIRSLTSSLKRLQKVVTSGFGLDKIRKELGELRNAIGNEDWGLSGLASSLSSIASASRRVGTVGDKLKGISELDFSNLQGAAESIGKIAESASQLRLRSGGSRKNSPIPGMALPTGDAESEYVESAQVAGDLGTEAEEAAAGLEDMAQAEDKVAKKGVNLRAVLLQVGKELGKSALNIGKMAVNLVTTPFEKFAQRIKRTIEPVRQFTTSIGRIAMYRSIRFIIASITASLKEGITNLYYYSQMAGTSFHKSMDMIATDLLYIKNSLASAAAPVINALAPALDFLADKIAQVLSLVAQLFSALTGKGTYSKAIKTTKKFAEDTTKSATTTTKALRMLIGGFDELNAFPEKHDPGSATGAVIPDYGSMFEEAKVEKKIGDFAKKIREAFKNGEWETLGNLLGDKLNEIIDKVQWRKLGQNLGKKIDGVIRTAYAFLKRVNFKKVGGSLADILNGVLETVDFEKAGRLFIRKITAALDFIIGFFEKLDWDKAAKAIGDFFKGAFREASEWLHDTDFAKLAQTLSDGIIKILDALLEASEEMDWEALGAAIGDFLGNIDWLGILTRVANLIWDVFSGVLSGLLSTDGGRMFVALVAAIKGVKLAFTLATSALASAAKSWVTAGMKPIEAMPDAVEQTGGKITSTLGKVAKAVGTAALGVFDLVLGAYDVKTLSEAANTYNEAQKAHNHETQTALESYAKLYRDKGKEVADQWAMMVYQIDTTNQNFDQAQESITKKIETYWDGVPQNMWEGFTSGWNHYFGENGEGPLKLLGDAFTGAVDGVKRILGINSPSKVFFGIGEDMVTGLWNGLKAMWNSVTTWLSNAAQGLTNLVKGVFRINSPSKVWSGIGTNLGLGLEAGLEGEQNRLLATANNLADSMTATMSPSPSYGTSRNYGENTDNTSALVSMLEQILLFMQTNERDAKVYIDGREVFRAVVNENNRAIQRTGASPIRV